MAFTIACFCGTVFRDPRTACPTCGAAVPAGLVRTGLSSRPSDGAGAHPA